MNDIDTIPVWASWVVWVVLPLLSATVTVGAACWLYDAFFPMGVIA